MFRALLELIITVLIAMVARAVLSSVLKSFGSAASSAFQQQQQQNPSGGQQQTQAPNVATGELHKDPVCGTYVSESTSFRRQVSGRTVYFCSENCRQKHAA